MTTMVCHHFYIPNNPHIFLLKHHHRVHFQTHFPTHFLHPGFQSGGTPPEEQPTSKARACRFSSSKPQRFGSRLDKNFQISLPVSKVQCGHCAHGNVLMIIIHTYIYDHMIMCIYIICIIIYHEFLNLYVSGNFM